MVARVLSSCGVEGSHRKLVDDDRFKSAVRDALTLLFEAPRQAI